MKKLLFFFASAAALFAFVSCDEKTDDTPEVPAQIEVTLTNLVKGDIVEGEINKLPVSASADGVELELTFYTDKVYLPAGTFTVGTAVGNYEGKVKAKNVEAAIKSGTITVADDGNDGYTLTGTLRLNNEAGTLAKLNATGTLAYELPTEYYYTLEKGSDANVYKIFDLENHQLASAAVVGAEEGTFDVLEGKALPGEANGGTWTWIDGFGTEIYLHGKVTVSTSHGKKVLKFEDNHTRIFNNCELKADITPALIKSDNAEENIFSYGVLAFNSVASPVVAEKTEVTFKLFFADGREFLSFVVVADEGFPELGGGGSPSKIISYADYKAYDATKYEGTKGRIVPVGTAFYVANGVKTEVGLSDDTGFFALINYAERNGVYGCVTTFLDASYALPDGLAAVLAGDGLNKIYSSTGILPAAE